MTAKEISLGSYIATERKKMELSQKQLAEKMDLSPQYLNDIEHDRRSPTASETLALFASALNLDVDYLHYLAGKLPDDIRAQHLSREDVGKVFHAFRKK